MIDDNTKQSKDKEIEAEDVDETPTGSSIEQARKILKSELDNKKDLIRQLETNASEVNIPNPHEICIPGYCLPSIINSWDL